MAGRDDAAMNLRNLKPGIDGRVHRDNVVVTVDAIEERAQIGE